MAKNIIESEYSKMPRPQPPEGYITAGEAARRLKVNDAMLSRYVKQGTLNRYGPETRKHKYYKESEVQTIVDANKAFFEAEPEIQNLTPIAPVLEEGLAFRQATAKDMEMENYFAYLNYWPGGTDPTVKAARRALPKCNKNSCYHLYDRGNLASSINFLPVTETAIEEFKQGKRGWLFVPDKVKQFTPGQPLHCIIIDFLSLPVAPPKRRSTYAMQLLLNLALLLKDWGSRGIDIATIHACGSTDLGRNILRNAGFQELGEPVPGRVIFELDVQSSDLKPLQPYKDALALWKQQQA